VFAVKERGKELAVPEAAPAVACTKAIDIVDVVDVTVSVRVALPVPLLLVAFSATVEVAAAVGVPEISPVVVLIDKPAGKPVAL
jgi:hypothetical protein